MGCCLQRNLKSKADYSLVFKTLHLKCQIYTHSPTQIKKLKTSQCRDKNTSLIHISIVSCHICSSLMMMSLETCLAWSVLSEYCHWISIFKMSVKHGHMKMMFIWANWTFKNVKWFQVWIICNINHWNFSVLKIISLHLKEN